MSRPFSLNRPVARAVARSAAWSATGAGGDPDLAAFIAASGATEIDALAAWVAGLKSAGLWDSIVSFPMRAGQNSADATIYSLGGLATPTAAQTGSPSVTSAGRVITVATQCAVTTWTPTDEASALIVAHTSPSTASDNNRIISCDVGATTRGIGMDGFGAATYRRLGAAFLSFFAIKTTSPSWLGVGYSAAANFSAKDATFTELGANAVQGPQSPLGIIGGGGTPTAAHLGSYAVSIYYSGRLTAANYEALRALYKDTIGSGLGLP